MELLDGETLTERLARRGRLEVGEALRIARQCAGSLAAAHARGIVHRDLKPDNIYLVREPEASGGERPKLLDFGICKLRGVPARSQTHTGTIFGTPGYMSPEQCRGAGGIDYRSDIYALGCVLFHMLTGRPPFDEEAPGDLMVAHMRDEPPAPSALVSGLSPELDDLVLCCLEKDPCDRFASMVVLQAAIAPLETRALAGPATLPTGTPVPLYAIASPPPIEASTWDLPEPRRSLRAAVLIGTAAIAFAIGGWVYGDGARRAAAVTAPSDATDDAILPVEAGVDASSPLGDGAALDAARARR